MPMKMSLTARMFKIGESHQGSRSPARTNIGVMLNHLSRKVSNRGFVKVARGVYAFVA